MHVHRPPIDLGAADLYAAHAAKKAAEAKQAVEVRRKLLRASANIDGESYEFVSLAIDKRSGDSSRQDADHDDFEPHSAGSSTRPVRADKSAGVPAEESLSIWA